MTVNTKGVVLTSSKDVSRICLVLERALNKLVRTGLEREFPGRKHFSEEARARFATPSLEIRDGDHIQARLTFNGQHRMLSFFLECDCDHLDLGPQSLSMSMGCHGDSVLIVSTVLQALSMFGPVYLDECDANETIGLQPLKAAQGSVLHCVKWGYLPQTRVAAMYEAYRTNMFRDNRPAFKTFFGVTEAELIPALRESDYKVSWDRIDELAKQLPEPSVLQEYPATLPVLLPLS